MKTQKSITRTRLIRIGLSILAIILLFAASLFIPWNVGALTSHPHPAQNYEEAVQRIDALKANRASEMNPDCVTQFMTHGKKVDHVIVLVHGYTNCPAQFHDLGQRFYDLGYNILIAPLPHHGLADRMNTEQAQLTAEELTAYADEVVDIAQGLGDHVSMMGFSMGGATTAWAVQNRSDIEKAIIISPAFGFKQIPTALTAPVMNVYLMLPNSFVWWDPALKEKIGPAHAYPRYSMRALAQNLRLSFAIQAQIRHSAPASAQVIMVTNANDASVNNQMTYQIIAQWRTDGAQIKTYEFPANLKLGHDLLDPQQPNQQVELVYPQLIALATQ